MIIQNMKQRIINNTRSIIFLQMGKYFFR